MTRLALRRWIRHSFQEGLSVMPTLALLIGAAPQLGFAQAPSASSPMRIGIIGSGNVGSTLGEFWVKAGHQVLFSSRNPENLKELVAKVGPRARPGTVSEAIAFGDVILIAVPYGSMAQI